MHNHLTAGLVSGAQQGGANWRGLAVQGHLQADLRENAGPHMSTRAKLSLSGYLTAGKGGSWKGQIPGWDCEAGSWKKNTSPFDL